jgi:hypothetical protein
MCAFGITYDDILIGNTSSTGKRFMGTTGMIGALD